VGLLQPKIVRDLNLYENGLRVVERRVQNFLPLLDGRYLLTGEGRTEHEVAKFNAKDSARYPAYQAHIRRVVDVLRGLSLVAPPNLVTGDLRVAVRELSQFATIGKKLWQARSLRAAFQLLRKSAGDILDTWFESDPIKAVLGFDAVVGNLASPYTPGSAYMLLHHVLGELNGKSGVWGYAIGGMGAITQAMARVAAKYGARIDVHSEVGEVIVERDRTVGVVLKDGTSVRARAVIANVNPQYLFESLLP
jgi:phytoene dehydrogenase-like protein